jgi:hypothetical protein
MYLGKRGKGGLTPPSPLTCGHVAFSSLPSCDEEGKGNVRLRTGWYSSIKQLAYVKM